MNEDTGQRGAAGGGRRAHIGSFTSAGGRGITTAALDPATGELTLLGATGVLADPSYLALAPDAPVLYAVSEGEHGTAAAFALGAEGPYPLGDPEPVGGAGPTHLSVAGPWLLTAHYTSGGVGALRRTPGGGLTGPPAVLGHQGSGPDPDRQTGPHAHQVLPDPSGRWAVCVDLGTDSLRVLALDPAGDTARPPLPPRPHAETALRPGSGPRHLAFHPGGRHLYVLNELAPTLTVCRWDPEKGAAEPLAEVPVAPGEASEYVRGYPSALVADPDGRFLWAAVRGHDAIAVLALDEDGAGAALTASVDCGGVWPRDLALDPVGRRLYAANERSGDVTWFDVDPETGLPHRAGSVDVPAATCVVFA
ncbi:lactonase family protein [Streptomyces sp. NPDC101118]|uniref:lactonase family protein n=1 Tax=Streptomyces sp. NPDC101118 TaxID=3366109 RepID=UPI0037FC8A50